MTRWVAAETLDRAAVVIADRPGIRPDDLAVALGMSPKSMTHLVSELRKTGEALPVDVITVAENAPTRAPGDPDQARILRRARAGIVVLSELPLDLTDSTPEELGQAVAALRHHGYVETPRGLFPTSAHYAPAARVRWLVDIGDDRPDPLPVPKSRRPPPVEPGDEPVHAHPPGRVCAACGRPLRRLRARATTERASSTTLAGLFLPFPEATPA